MASPPDPRLYEMIDLHHFAQLAIKSRYFSNKKFVNFQTPSFSKILVARLFIDVS